MFIGHFAVAFALKRVAPEVKLGTAILAATLLDVLWPLFMMAGFEFVKIDPGGGTAFTSLRFPSYPFSHSLALALVWGVLFAWIYTRRGGSWRAGAWLLAAVVSHWFLDLLTHEPDLQLVPEVDVYVGLGLWNSVPATLIVEGLLFAGGIWLYLAATRARDRIGVWGFWGLVALLLISYFGTAFGPPPPNVGAIVVVGILGAAISVAWGYWVDRHRETTPPPRGGRRRTDRAS